jgi:hypothetical protein
MSAPAIGPKLTPEQMEPNRLYRADLIEAGKQRAKRGRPMRELLAADFATLTPREQDRIYRRMAR